MIGVQFKSSNDPENLPEGWHLWTSHEWAITIKTRVICKSIDLFNTKIIKKGENYQFPKSWCYLLHTLIDEGRKKKYLSQIQQTIFPVSFAVKTEKKIFSNEWKQKNYVLYWTTYWFLNFKQLICVFCHSFHSWNTPAN